MNGMTWYKIKQRDELSSTHLIWKLCYSLEFWSNAIWLKILGFFVLFYLIFKTMQQAVFSCEISHYLIDTPILWSPDAKN